MIHTFSARHQLTRIGYDIFESKLQDYVKKCKEERMSYNAFPIKNCSINVHGYNYIFTGGLQIKTMRIDGVFPFFWIELEVNLATMLYGKNPYKITEMKDIPNAVAILNEKLAALKLDLRLDDFYMSRADFAFNLKLADINQVEKYMKLLKKYNSINSYKEHTVYSSRGHRHKTFPNSIYLVSGSRNINIYIKQDQVDYLKEKCPDYFENKNIEEEDIIRFEIQNKSRGVDTIANSNSFDSKSPSQFLSEDLSYEETAKYVKKLYGTGDYYTYNESYQIIMNTRFAGDMKLSMVFFMQRATRIPIHIIKDEYLEKGYSVEEVRAILNNFDKLNINPVPIPASWGYRKIPGPFTYITSRTSNIEWER